MGTKISALGAGNPALAGDLIPIARSGANYYVTATSIAALASGGAGTVTSVAALTLGTTGTDLSSSVANGTTTPVITLNVPSASASNRGVLTSADWTAFNAKQAAISFGTGVQTALGVAVGSAGAFVVNGGALGTPASGTLTNATGLPISTGVSGLGTGIATALGINVGSAGAPIVLNGALGTPSSGVATNITGLPISTGLTGAGTGVLTALGVNVGSAGAFVTFNGAGGTPSSLTLTNATGLVATTGLTATGTKDSTTFLRGDNTWAVPSGGGSPGGSTTQLQYNNAGAFGGTNIYVGTNLWQFRNSTSAQKLEVYNTYTDASNYERGVFDWSTTANTLTIGTQNAGTGTERGLRLGVSSVPNAIAIAPTTGNVTTTGALTVTNTIGWAGGFGADSNHLYSKSLALVNTATTYDSDTTITRKAAATYQLGAVDVASPVARTLTVQSVVAGTSNTAGVDWTLKASAGTGTGAGGKFVFQVAPAGSTGTAQNAYVTALSIDSGKAVLAVSTGGLGYGTGAGGAVTQITSRTTGVTLNTPTGAITLVSAAGTTAIQAFTVTNSTVAATDTIQICQKSGTDRYRIYVTAVGAGSFEISYATLSGTTTEQPVFNFAVIKGVTS
jgi:hypothetical protein